MASSAKLLEFSHFLPSKIGTRRHREIGSMTTTTESTQRSNIWWVFLLQGLAGILLGVMLLTEPSATLLALTTFLGFYWLITGVLALVRVFTDRAVPWIWSLLVGFLGIASGILVLKHSSRRSRRLPCSS